MTVGERRSKGPPLRYDWRRVYRFEHNPPRIFYVVNPNEHVALQVTRSGGSWQWLVVGVDGKVIVRSGVAGGMHRAKLAAEANIDTEPDTKQLTLIADDDPVPF